MPRKQIYLFTDCVTLCFGIPKEINTGIFPGFPAVCGQGTRMTDILYGFRSSCQQRKPSISTLCSMLLDTAMPPEWPIFVS